MFKSFYGWKIVWAAALINFFSIGLPFYAFSVFYIHLQEEFNASRFLISSTLSILIIALYLYLFFLTHKA